jgi:hypothetical protein
VFDGDVAGDEVVAERLKFAAAVLAPAERGAVVFGVAAVRVGTVGEQVLDRGWFAVVCRVM